MSILRNSPLYFVILILTLAAAMVSTAVANNDLVEVSGSVEFKANVPPYKWNAIFIDLKANKNTQPDAPDTQYVDNVKVILTLGFDLGERDGKNQFSFYQAEATLVSLEQSKRTRIAFMLPKEIVDRDDLDNEPKYWTIDLEVDGETLPMRRGRSSSSISDAKSLDYFRNAYSSGISDTEGILVPAHLSPYGYGFGDRRDPPAIIWKQTE